MFRRFSRPPVRNSSRPTAIRSLVESPDRFLQCESIDKTAPLRRSRYADNTSPRTRGEIHPLLLYIGQPIRRFTQSYFNSILTSQTACLEKRRHFEDNRRVPHGHPKMQTVLRILIDRTKRQLHQARRYCATNAFRRQARPSRLTQVYNTVIITCFWVQRRERRRAVVFSLACSSSPL